MIATQVDNVYEVRSPEAVKTMLHQVSRALTLGIDVGLEATPLKCFGLGGYTAEMLFYMFVPMALLGLLFVVTIVRLAYQARCGNGAITRLALLQMTAPYSLQLLFLMYPIVTRNAFEAFSFRALLPQRLTAHEPQLRINLMRLHIRRR